MIIAGIYSFNNGEAVIRSRYPSELGNVEIEQGFHERI
jgi:hypothetical protein